MVVLGLLMAAMCVSMLAGCKPEKREVKVEKGEVLDHVVRPPVRRILGEKIKAGRDHLRESLLGQLGRLVIVKLPKRFARQIRRRFFRSLRGLGGGCLRVHGASEGECSQQGNNDGA